MYRGYIPLSLLENQLLGRSLIFKYFMYIIYVGLISIKLCLVMMIGMLLRFLLVFLFWPLG